MPSDRTESGCWDVPIDFPATAGRIYDLAQPLRPGLPRHPNHPPFAFSLTKLHGDVVSDGGVSASSEVFVTGGHVGTHVDALCHVARRGEIHGGVAVGELQSFERGIEIHGVDQLQPIVGRAHVVDVPRLLGRDARPGDGVGAAEFDRWFAEHESPQPDSIVLVRTGWARHWNDSRTYLGLQSGCPGVTSSGADWLSRRRIAATGADTIAYEQTPAPELPVHVHLLFERGIPIMEAMNLESLAADGVASCFFTAAPLRIVNGTGSPIRPLAFV